MATQLEFLAFVTTVAVLVILLMKSLYWFSKNIVKGVFFLIMLVWTTYAMSAYGVSLIDVCEFLQPIVDISFLLKVMRS